MREDKRPARIYGAMLRLYIVKLRFQETYQPLRQRHCSVFITPFVGTGSLSAALEVKFREGLSLPNLCFNGAYFSGMSTLERQSRT